MIDIVVHHIHDHLDIMRASGIEDEIPVAILDLIHILHFQAYNALIIDLGLVRAVRSDKMVLTLTDSQVIGEPDQASPPVPAHTTLPAIRIIIFHFKIITRLGIQQHQPVGPDAKPPVTYELDSFKYQGCITPSAII